MSSKPEDDLLRIERRLGRVNASLLSLISKQETATAQLKTVIAEVLSRQRELAALECAPRASETEITSAKEDRFESADVLESLRIPIVAVGLDLRTVYLSREAVAVFNLAATDVGRPIRELTSELNALHAEDLMRKTISDSSLHWRKGRHSDGRPYSICVRPLVTAEGKTEGAVMIYLIGSDLRPRTEFACDA